MAITLTYAQLTELYVKQYKSETSQLTQRTANILKNPSPFTIPRQYTPPIPIQHCLLFIDLKGCYPGQIL